MGLAGGWANQLLTLSQGHFLTFCKLLHKLTRKELTSTSPVVDPGPGPEFDRREFELKDSILLLNDLLLYSNADFYFRFLGDHFNFNICQGSGGTILLSLFDCVDHVVVGLLPLVLHLVVVGVYVLEILGLSSCQSLLLHVKSFPGVLCIFCTNLLKCLKSTSFLNVFVSCSDYLFCC